MSKNNQDPNLQDQQDATLFRCALREKPARIFSPNVNIFRQDLINFFGNKWTSGTVLHYYFFDQDTDGENVLFANGTRVWRTWVGDEEEKDVVRRGFDAWQTLGTGIRFLEVENREDAEIRIGFMQGDGAWSWLGREILDFGLNERTMNFGWKLASPRPERPEDIDTAIHEIGHTLGFPHEHQNPNAGIVWDDEAVYADLAKPPNRWSRERTFWNIIRKLPASEIEGTTWDPDSVMHYPFNSGLIKEPSEYYASGLQPAGGLSSKDISWAKSLYPPVNDTVQEELKPSQSVLLHIQAGEQRHFMIKPKETRNYTFQTFGTSDTVMVLFEDDDGQPRYRTADDDSGQENNAHFQIKLIKGKTYILRVRAYYVERPEETAVMMW